MAQPSWERAGARALPAAGLGLQLPGAFCSLPLSSIYFHFPVHLCDPAEMGH